MTGELLEQALASVAASNLPAGYSVTKGLDDATKTAKRVIAQASEGVSSSPQPGNFRHRCVIAIESNPNDVTETAHGTASRTLFGGFMDTTLATTLTAAVSGFTCLYVFPKFTTRNDISKKLFRSELEFEVVCCASNIS